MVPSLMLFVISTLPLNDVATDSVSGTGGVGIKALVEACTTTLGWDQSNRVTRNIIRSVDDAQVAGLRSVCGGKPLHMGVVVAPVFCSCCFSLLLFEFENDNALWNVVIIGKMWKIATHSMKCGWKYIFHQGSQSCEITLLYQ